MSSMASIIIASAYTVNNNGKPASLSNSSPHYARLRTFFTYAYCCHLLHIQITYEPPVVPIYPHLLQNFQHFHPIYSIESFLEIYKTYKHFIVQLQTSLTYHSYYTNCFA